MGSDAFSWGDGLHEQIAFGMFLLVIGVMSIPKRGKTVKWMA